MADPCDDGDHFCAGRVDPNLHITASYGWTPSHNWSPPDGPLLYARGGGIWMGHPDGAHSGDALIKLGYADAEYCTPPPPDLLLHASPSSYSRVHHHRLDLADTGLMGSGLLETRKTAQSPSTFGLRRRNQSKSSQETSASTLRQATPRTTSLQPREGREVRTVGKPTFTTHASSRSKPASTTGARASPPRRKSGSTALRATQAGRATGVRDGIRRSGRMVAARARRLRPGELYAGDIELAPRTVPTTPLHHPTLCCFPSHTSNMISLPSRLIGGPSIWWTACGLSMPPPGVASALFARHPLCRHPRRHRHR